MGYFDKITEADFIEKDNGETIYYPYQALGKGRVIKDPILKYKLFKHQKRFYKYLLPFCTFYGGLLGLGGTLSLSGILPIIIIIFVFLLRQRYLILGLPICNEKLDIKESYIKLAKAYHPLYLLFMMAFSVIFIAFSLLMLFMIGKPVPEVFYLPVGIGVFLLIVTIYLYKLNKSNKEAVK